jgi:hypothetical protein
MGPPACAAPPPKRRLPVQRLHFIGHGRLLHRPRLAGLVQLQVGFLGGAAAVVLACPGLQIQARARVRVCVGGGGGGGAVGSYGRVRWRGPVGSKGQGGGGLWDQRGKTGGGGLWDQRGKTGGREGAAQLRLAEQPGRPVPPPPPTPHPRTSAARRCLAAASSLLAASASALAALTASAAALLSAPAARWRAERAASSFFCSCLTCGG